MRLPLTLLRPRPLDEAISSAGGVRFRNEDTRGIGVMPRRGFLPPCGLT